MSDISFVKQQVVWTGECPGINTFIISISLNLHPSAVVVSQINEKRLIVGDIAGLNKKQSIERESKCNYALNKLNLFLISSVEKQLLLLNLRAELKSKTKTQLPGGGELQYYGITLELGDEYQPVMPGLFSTQFYKF